ncbi:hypothetical protein ACQPZG_06625 [Streptomyces sp. CA-294286]|uniref:hypothetical protein n=1 Tax=Streptomyces sp. CA-294286 TaxID=3240070 RepID=UPI003D9430A5
MTLPHVPLAAGGVAKFTGVLWQDVLLNAALYAGFVGIGVWLTWWWQERKRGVRGAAEKHRALGRRMRTRRVLAALSIAGSLAQIASGLAMVTRDSPDDDGQALLVCGGITALAWLFVLPLCRPLPRPSDDRAVRSGPTRQKPWVEVSYEHLPSGVPGRGGAPGKGGPFGRGGTSGRGEGG